jgi:hypothetical protein
VRAPEAVQGQRRCKRLLGEIGAGVVKSRSSVQGVVGARWWWRKDGGGTRGLPWVLVVG